MAHMLDEDGAAEELVTAGGRVPLLEPEQVVLLGWGPEEATPREREAVQRLGLPTIDVGKVRADPTAAAAHAVDLLRDRCDRLLVHFDVDVVDFTDTPLSENPGRNEGISYEQAIAALTTIVPQAAGLTLTELNPAHVEEGADSVQRLARDLAGAWSH
jgi:arginase